MSEGITSIRIVCDKVAAHKMGKPTWIDDWEYSSEFNGVWWPKGSTRNGQPRTRAVLIPNPAPDSIRNLFPSGGRDFKRVWYEMACKQDCCKSDIIQGRGDSIHFALNYFASAGVSEVSLDQLRAILSRDAGRKRTAAEALSILRSESTD